MSRPVEEVTATEAQRDAAPTLDYISPSGGSQLLDLASVLIKLMGLWLLVRGLPQFIIAPWWAVDFSSPQVIRLVIGMAMGALTWILPGLLLMFRTDWITALIFRGQSRYDSRIIPESVDLQAMAFAVAGAIIAIYGLSGIAREVMWYVQTTAQRNAGNIPQAYASNLPTLIVQTLLGAGLFFRARGLAVLWHRLRHEPARPNSDRDAV